MSIKIMSQVWEHSKQKGSTLLLLLALADYADDEGFCWPAIETLAKKIRMSERTVMRLVDGLENAGELEVYRRPAKGNRYVVLAGANEYGDEDAAAMRILSADLRLSPSKGDKMEGDNLSVKGDNLSVKGDIAMSPDPSINPSKEPPVASNGSRPEYFTVYEQNVGPLTPHIADVLGDYADDPLCPVEWIGDAIKEAAENGVRKLNYITAILDRWMVEGRDAPKPDLTIPAPEDDPYLTRPKRTAARD